MNGFYQDVSRGLSAPSKHIDSKYFYDEHGDKLFEQIMSSPEYYLTNCELEIFSGRSTEIIEAVLTRHSSFDVIELGAGNALKSGFFLKELVSRKIDFTYFPVDISSHVIQQLKEELPVSIPGLQIHTLCGEYLEMLRKAVALSSRPKLVLFLGSNIGNFTPEQAALFFLQLKRTVNTGDMLLTGFDLKKNPRIILDAYNDKAGITRAFNLNLLQRINRELDADFNVAEFDHFPSYDPQTGACKSYLVSLKNQMVRIGEADFFFFKEGETISTEISQKYSLEEIRKMAEGAGFRPCNNFHDSNNWFVDSLWQAGS